MSHFAGLCRQAYVLMNVLRRLYRRGRADRWSALFGQVAVYSFVVTAVTGVFLLFFYKPSMTQVTYHGSYRQLDGVPVSQAYRSTLDISFDVRGGLLMRQIHHWAALMFIAAVCLHLLRLYFTGAFRRPRWLNWVIWVTLLVLGMVAGESGAILPDDMMSGGSLNVVQGVALSIPVVGTRLMLWIFGAGFPGTEVISRAYWLHVAVLPPVMVALLALLRRRARPAVTPVSVAMFWLTCGALALLGTFAQVNPVWLFGPYQPGSITAGVVPGWYMGFIDGALRIMPGWEINVIGHPLTLDVLVPAVIMPGAFFTLLAAYPLLDRRLTGDRAVQRFLDRPRDAATRTAVGAAGITFYGVLWAAAANDEIAYHLHVSLYAITWFFRIAVLAAPALAFVVTQRMCLGLSRRERDEAEHGRETGRIVMSPDGGYREIREPARRLSACGHGSICSGPPPLLTVSEERADGSVAIPTSCVPPPLSAVSAYGPPGTVRNAGPPSVLTVTVSGAAAKAIAVSPPPVVTVAVVAVTPRAIRFPPPVSARSAPVSPNTIRFPPPAVTVSGPSIRVACTSPPPESRFAPAVPETETGPPWVAAVTVTPGGTVTAKSMLQSDSAQAGSPRASWPPDTVSITAGGPPAWRS